MHNDFVILFEKINRFITKYYQNLLVKGLILSVAIIFSFFILVDLIEYFAWAGSLTRAFIFYIFIGLTAFVLIFFMLLPGIKLMRIGKTMSTEDAATIIGTYFPEVSDKLLNAIQLGELEGSVSKSEYELLMASISQKAIELKPIPFTKAIAIRKNIRYVKYALPPILVIAVMLLVFPSFITEPSRRIINHNEVYSKPLPYELQLNNTEFSVLQHDDYTVSLQAMGDELPAQIYVNDGNYNYRMLEVTPASFAYTFADLNEDLFFTIQTADFKSNTYHIRVMPKPVIFNFHVALDYPNYLNRRDDFLENSGDLVVPEGTRISWTAFTRDARSVMIRKPSELIEMKASSDNSFTHSDQATSSFAYTMFAENEYVVSSDSMTFSLQVIKDEYPSIRAGETMDAKLFEPLFFQGLIGDDHGFHKLTFYYKNEDVDQNNWKAVDLNIRKDIESQSFNFMFDTDSLGLKAGATISYYFEVRDNDALHAYKKSKTAIQLIQFPTEDDLKEDMASNSEEIKDKVKELLGELDKVNKRIEEYKKNLFEKNDMSWLDRNQMMNLLEKEALMQEQIKELNKLNEEVNELAEKLEEKMSPELKEKMDELQKLMEELMDEDLEKQLEELKKELQNMNKEELQKMLEKMKEENEDLKTDLEQSLELYKQMEVEKKAEEIINKLEQLSEEQKQLSDESLDKKKDTDQLLEKQQEIKKDFDALKKDLAEMDTLNKDLEQPMDMSVDSADLKETDDQLQEAEDKLSKNKAKKASENQKSAAMQMKEMAKSLSNMLQQEMQSRLAEDAEMVKRMLDNLLDLSFEQENLIDLVANTSFNDPKYIDNADQQQLLKTDYKIVHDSLQALSRRQLMIKPFVVKESETIESYMDRTLASLQERRKGQALKEQQYIMTSMNNLALMLVESLNQMKQKMDMPGNSDGKSKCKNPGQGGPGSMEQLIQMQGKLNKGMQGKANEQGQEGEDGINGQSETLSRMAAQQAEIRRALSQMLEDLEKGGAAGQALSESIEEMKKIEEDIINRRITDQTLARQKQLEVRLLKSQKALQEREQEERRKSEEGKNKNRSNQNLGIEYKDSKESKEEVLISNPIEMTPYYKSLLKKYRYTIDQKKDGEQ